MTSIIMPRPIEPFTIYAMSDLHIESDRHDRDMLLEDLEKARKDNARIFLGGDVWSNIFPSDKKRYTASQQVAQVDALLDYVINKAFDLLKPYCNMIDLMCTGNHETSVLKYHHTDPTNDLRKKLQSIRDPKLPHIRHGGYRGYISISFQSKGKSNHSKTEHWYYHHGKGGNAPVTNGAIDLYRVRAGNVADVYWLGHKHTNVSDIPVLTQVDKNFNIVRKPVLSFFTAGYEGKVNQREYEKDGYILDWAEENFYQQQSQGCAKIVYNPIVQNGMVKIRKEIIKAVA